MLVRQPSLLEVGDQPVVGSLGTGVERLALGSGAWVDHRPGWVAGSEALTERLLGTVDWRAQRRQMYEREVDVPRLLRFYEQDEELPDPLLARLRAALDEHYAGELGEPFATTGLCLYRDGRDSVAWHGDRIGRGRREDTLVAILSLGAARTFALRPRARPGPGQTPGPRRAIRLVLGPGDLVVMGGSCQRTWEHAVPKTARPVGPRVSVQFRPRDVR